MDPSSAIGSVLAAVGLSGGAGLNAWLPLLGTALAGRLGVIDLDSTFDGLQSTPALVGISAAFVLDFVGDKVPVVDHVLHAVGAVIHPVAGAVLFGAQAGVAGDLDPTLALVLGAVTSGTIHAGRAGIRPFSTAGTAGTGNPVLSFVEDAVSFVLTGLAFLLPILAAVLAVAVLVGVAVVWLRLRRTAVAGRG